MGYFLTAEQSLDLTLCRCITFLHLSTADLDGDSVLCALEEPVAPPHAVTSGTSAKQDDDISRIRSQSLITARLGAAPITAPISIRFAT